MVTNNGILMIEPSGSPSPTPIIDELTRNMTAIWRKRRDSDYSFRGFHVCNCGAHSDNKEHWLGVDNLLTNSLCIHYLAFHRKDVPEVEQMKVSALASMMFDDEPNEQELNRPRR